MKNHLYHWLGLVGLLTTSLIAQSNIHVPNGTVGNIGGSNVGIGTTTPSQALEVNEGDIQIKKATADSRLRLVTGTIDFRIASQLGGNLAFYDATNSAYRMLISSSGNVGIGTATPGRKLEVNHDLGVTSGEKFIANFTQSAGQNGLYLGYRANGSAVTSTLIRSDNTLPITFGTSGSNEAVTIINSGNVGIGTTSPSHKLAVNGTIRAKEVIVDTGWSDYVFAEDYRLAPLSEIETHVRERKRLPGIPSAAEVEAGGVSLGDMQSKLLAKIEELTLHAIAQNKRLDDQAARIAALERENQQLLSR